MFTGRVGVTLILALASAAQLRAQRAAPHQETSEEFTAKLNPQTGVIPIRSGLATLRVPQEFRFIGPEGARRLLVDEWRNPPGVAEGVLGVLFPAQGDLLAADSWAVVITYDEDGYVDDRGAETIDYAKLLHQMQEGARSVNEDRRRQGYPAVEVVGWATPPHYDQPSHKLYWAKELAFSDQATHTLNYNVRVLGRRGVLVLNAVADINALPDIERAMQSVLGFVDFNEGHRYQDFVASTDKKAAYGIAGLIAGAVAMKAGLFKALWLGILAFKKLIIVGLAAAGVALRKVFKKASPPTPGVSA
jgi:uncharacterized membrane-anchored protein